MSAGAVWGIVVAAGGGDRYGGPKQYELLGGRRVIDLALAATRAVCASVVAVVPGERIDDPIPADAVVAGGTTRSASVRAGLTMVPVTAEVVVVHDAARPLAPPALFRLVVEAVRSGADAAVPGLVVTDTLKQVDDEGRVTATIPRDGIVVVQTPQAFRAEVLRRAHQAGGEATDDARLVESTGATVVVVTGHRLAAKITEPLDLAVLEALAAGEPGVGGPRVGEP